MENELTPVPLAAHGSYIMALACTDDCAPCAPVRAQQREKNNAKAKRTWAGRTTISPHGTTTRAAVCTDACAECGPIRIHKREKGRRYREGLVRPKRTTAYSAPPSEPEADYEGRDEYLAHLKDVFA